MKNVLVRFYSAMNLGDDLFVYILATRYKDNFYLNRRTKFKSFKDFDNLKPALTAFGSVLYRLSWRVRGWAPIASRRNLKKADLLVYAGGSIFQEGASLQRWRHEQQMYRALSVPYYILGSNFGPAKTTEFKNIVEDIISHSEDTCFRDEASYEAFKHLPTVRCSTDLAFTLETAQFQNLAKQKCAVISVIDVSWRFEKGIADKYELEMGKLVSELLRQGFRVTVMSFCKKEGDERAIARILSRMSTLDKVSLMVYRYRGDLEEALQIISSAEIVVGSRFHAVILALLFQIKVLPVAYSDKTLSILNDIDFKGPILDIRNIESFDGGKFDFRTLEKNDVRREKELAEAQFKQLDEVLQKK